MTTSLKTWTCYAEDDQTKMTASDKAYFRAKTRRQAYNAVLQEFSKLSGDDGLSRSKLARRLGVQRSQITRWLSSPGNWTLDTLSDLLLAMRCMAHIASENLSVQEKGQYVDPKTVSAEAINPAAPKSRSEISTHVFEMKTDELQPLRKSAGETTPTPTLRAA